MPRLCWMMMPWGQRSIWVIFGLLEIYNEPCQLYVCISGITGKSCSIRFQRGTICLGYVGWSCCGTESKMGDFWNFGNI